MSLRVVTPPAVEPVSLSEAKQHLKETSGAEDALITAWIVAARELAEHETGRALISQTLEKSLDAFPASIRLDRPIVSSVTSVKFLDGVGDEQTLSSQSYQLDKDSDSGPAWLVPAAGYAWPETHRSINCVRIRYQAGWANAGLVPASIKLWILLQVGHCHANREATVQGNLQPLPFLAGLLDRWRIWS